MWLAALTLFFLAPICGEVLSSSTPPTEFLLNPINLIYQPALYGSGALLIREIVRRRGLGWSNLLLLGAVYGILEEGVVTNTWFNPVAGVGYLGIYGRLFGVNWLWALELTAFHAVVSIAIPIVLVDALFPQIAGQPWLRATGSCLFTALFAGAALAGAIGWGFFFYAKEGYHHPPAIYLLAVALTIGGFVLGLRLRLPEPAPARRVPPGLWKLRCLALAATITFFLIVWLVPRVVSVALVPVALLLVLLLGLAVVLRRWSTVPYWGAPHRLALATGVLAFFVLFTTIRYATTRPLDALVMVVLDLALSLLLVQLARQSKVFIQIPGSMSW